MTRDIDLKNRVVEYHNVDNTATIEDEVIDYLKKHMKVRFYDACFNNRKYVFTGSPNDKHPNSLTINGYRVKVNGDCNSVVIE